MAGRLRGLTACPRHSGRCHSRVAAASPARPGLLQSAAAVRPISRLERPPTGFAVVPAAGRRPAAAVKAPDRGRVPAPADALALGPFCPTQIEGEFREVYLPLSQEEIENDLQQLYEAAAAAAQHQHRRAAAGLRPGVVPAGGSSSDELSPSSAQGEDENESGNPAEQQLWAAGPKAAAGVPAMPPAAQQPMALA